MTGLLAAEARLLDRAQRSFPVSDRPFRELGAAAGISESKTLEIFRRRLADGFIRRVYAVGNAAAFGYRSLLAALWCPPESIADAAARINAHPGVGHNYLRDHEWNIWFTLSCPLDTDIQAEVDSLLDGIVPRSNRLLLPAQRVFKRFVRFPLSRDGQHDSWKPPVPANEPLSLSAGERRIAAAVQEGIPLTRRPFHRVGESIGIDGGDVIAVVNTLLEKGALVRLAAVLRQRRAGFRGNGMACFAVSPEKMTMAAGIVAGRPEVSHCYERAPLYGEWAYPLFAMVHAVSRKECRRLIDEIGAEIDAEYIVLFSEREFKKERVVYR